MSAEQFTKCGDVIPVEYNKYAVHFRNSKPVPEFSQTNYRTRIQLPLLNDRSAKLCRAFLACTRTSKEISSSRKEYVYLDLCGSVLVLELIHIKELLHLSAR
jgi:hypothetical protein